MGFNNFFLLQKRGNSQHPQTDLKFILGGIPMLVDNQISFIIA